MQNKRHYLEGLRGVAAFSVFYIHLLPSYFPSLLEFLCFGQPQNFSVAIFFILSGRVVTLSNLAKGDFAGIGRSIIKRPLRLGLPLAMVTILNALVLAFTKSRYFTFLETFVVPWHFMITKGTLMAPLVGVSWTLSHEFEGSLIVYLISLAIMSISKERGKIVVLSVTLAYTLFTHSWASHFIVGLAFAEADRIGALTAINNHQYGGLFKVWMALAGCLLFTSPFLIGEPLLQLISRYQYVGAGRLGVDIIFWQENPVVLILSALFLYLVETTSWIQSIFCHRFFVWLGRVSFMLYLSHIIIQEEFFIPIQESYGIIEWGILGKFVFTILATLMALLFAEILTVWVDIPSVWCASYIAKEVLNGDWEFKDILKSLPFWPIWVVAFIYGRFGATYISIRGMFIISPLAAYRRVSIAGDILGKSPSGMDMSPTISISI